MSKILITEVVSLDDPKNSPILLNFENGEILPSTAKSMQCALAKDSSKGYPLVALAATTDTVYTGLVNKGYPQHLMGTYIGIRNKTTNKMRLIEVSHCAMVSHHYDRSSTDLESTDREAAKRILLKQYGSKNDRNILERRERMKVNVDIVKEQLDKTVDDFTEIMESKASVKDQFDVKRKQQEETLSLMLPPLNKEAKKIEEIYALTELIDVSLLERLNDEALEILKTAPEHMPFEPNYLLDIVLGIQCKKEPDSIQNLTKIKVCIYIDALINFVSELGEKRRNKDMKHQSFSKISEKVESNIRDLFSIPDSIKLVKSEYTRNKALCYILVLSLLISDKCTLNFDRLVEATNVSKTSLMALKHTLPIRHKRESNEITFKLPSQMTDTKKFFRRRQ